MRRFYDRASVASDEDGHGVLLDGRPLRTPARRALLAPTPELAQAIAGEWQAQGEEIRPDAMPLTRLASTALDRMPGLRDAAIGEVAGYARTDLLCHRVDEPLELVQRQQRMWQPLLDWAAETHGARLIATTSILPVEQPAPALARLRSLVAEMGDWTLVGLHAATTALGSVILGLALAARRLDSEEALDASLLEELFEIERWGADVEIERRHAVLRREVAGAEAFLRSLA